MISRLVRLELESYLHDLVAWGGKALFLLVLFLSFVWIVNARLEDSLSAGLSGVFLLSVGLSSALLAVKLSGRNAIEKRTRLFSQLPVTTREASFASWFVRLLCLLIPTLAFSVFLARVTNMPFATFVLVALAAYLGGTTLVAAIALESTIRHLPSPIASWAKSVYIGSAIAIVAIWFAGNMLVFPRFPFTAYASLWRTGLPGLITLLMISGIALVVVDVWLRDRLDDYLE